MELENIGRRFGIIEYIQILRKRWIIALISLLSVIVTTTVYESQRVPMYTAFIEILIKPDPMSEQVRTMQPAARKRMSDMNFEYYVEHARSDACVDEVVRTGVLGAVPPPKSPAWLNLVDLSLRAAQAEQVGDRRIVRISVHSTDPEFVYRVANAYGPAYVSSLNEELLSTTRRMIEYIDQEIHKIEMELAHYRTAVAVLGGGTAGAGTTLTGITPDRLAAARGSLRDRMRAVAHIAAALQSGLTPSLEEMELAITGVMGAVPEPLAQTLGGTARDQLETARSAWSERLQRYKGLSRTLTDLHPDKAAARSSLFEASVDLIQKIGTWYRVVDAQLAERGATLTSQGPGAMPADARSAAGISDTLLTDPMAIDRYRTELSLREGLLNELIRKKASLQLDLSGRENMAEWIRPARRPDNRDLPEYNRILPLGFALGLLVAAAAVILVESFDSSIKMAHLAETVLGKRVLGMVPRFTDDISRNPAAHLIVTGRPTSPEAEAYRALAQKMDVQPQRLVVVTSTGPQEGKSTTSANLSIALAEMGRRVILVSANFRRPTLHTFFGFSESPGLRDVINETAVLEDVIQHTMIETLDLLPSGTRTLGTIASIISSPQLGATLRKLCETYDFVITDVPPSAPVSDALNFARHADGVLLVYMVGKASEAAVSQVIRSIEDVGGQIIGIVMNDVKGVGAGYGYGYNYAEGYYRYEDERR